MEMAATRLKKIGIIAAMSVVANAEFAQSYMHQAFILLRSGVWFIAFIGQKCPKS